MAETSAPLTAPGRGHYDRRQPREARLLEQRERLLSATAGAIRLSAAPTVAAVVKLAGVSRNTFYEYFDDLGHARREAERRAQQRLEGALVDAEARTRTPVDRWRALAQAWFAWAAASPADASLCLVPDRDGLSAAGRELEAALARSLRSAGVKPIEALGVTAVAATGEAFMRLLFHVKTPPVPAATESVAPTPELGTRPIATAAGARAIQAEAAPQVGPGRAVLGPNELGRVERALVDVAVRLLR